MQTAYYTTENFIRHSGNVVDLTEFRRRLERATAGREQPSVPQKREVRTSSCRRIRAGLLADICAGAAIVVMTAVVTIQFLVA